MFVSSLFSFSSLNLKESLLAIVPRFVSSSSFVIPHPLSSIVNVRFSLLASIFISSSSKFTLIFLSVKER